MSKTFCEPRVVLVSVLLLLQLILLPATQLLHLGCQHSHGEHQVDSDFNLAKAARNFRASTHCCSHCSHGTRDDQPGDSDPLQPPHDEDNCALCQIVLAARMMTAATVSVASAEPVCEFTFMESQPVDSTPRYCVLSRGPPASLLG